MWKSRKTICIDETCNNAIKHKNIPPYNMTNLDYELGFDKEWMMDNLACKEHQCCINNCVNYGVLKRTRTRNIRICNRHKCHGPNCYNERRTDKLTCTECKHLYTVCKAKGCNNIGKHKWCIEHNKQRSQTNANSNGKKFRGQKVSTVYNPYDIKKELLRSLSRQSISNAPPPSDSDSGSDSNSNTNSNSASSVQSESITSLLSDVESESSSSDILNCVICWNEQKNVLIMPCKHICTCEGCSNKLKTCPICRGQITKMIPGIFIS